MEREARCTRRSFPKSISLYYIHPKFIHRWRMRFIWYAIANPQSSSQVRLRQVISKVSTLSASMDLEKFTPFSLTIDLWDDTIPLAFGKAPPSSRGPGRGPLKAQTGVRI